MTEILQAILESPQNSLTAKTNSSWSGLSVEFLSQRRCQDTSVSLLAEARWWRVLFQPFLCGLKEVINMI